MFGYLKDRNENPYLERVPERFIEDYIKGNAHLTSIEDRDHHDYIYNVKELLELKGNRFHDKKNLVNQFRKNYRYEYIELSAGLIGECLEFEDHWCRIKECGKSPGLERERCAILEMLKNFDSLDIRGGAIRIGGKIAAIALGEKVSPEILVIHVEKANPDIPGLYQSINQEFLMHEAGGCRLVNREQDLGVPGLRKAKMSYNPVGFIKKYKVGIRQ
jgi:hypothetical protein